MELKLEHGDYVRREIGTLERLSDQESLAQRVRIRLTVPRGRFPFWETLGSRLYLLGRIPPRERASAAKQYVTEALAEEEVTVKEVQVRNMDTGGATLDVTLQSDEQTMTTTVSVTG